MFGQHEKILGRPDYPAIYNNVMTICCVSEKYYKIYLNTLNYKKYYYYMVKKLYIFNKNKLVLPNFYC